MAITSAAYGTCPSCKALNMAHRKTCYRCGTTVTPPIRQTTPDPHHIPNTPSDRRQSKRYEINLCAEMLDMQGVKQQDVTIRNIGMGGLLYDCTVPCPVGERIVLRIPLGGRTYIVVAVIRHVGRVLSNELPYANGVEFVDPDPGLLRQIGLLDEAPNTWR